MFNNQTKSENEEWTYGDLCYDCTDEYNQHMVRQGISYFEIGQYEKAKQSFQLSIAQFARTYSGLFNLGCTLMKDPSQLGEAKKYFEECIFFHPKRFEPYINLAEVLYYLGKYQQSLTTIEKALRMNPKIRHLANYFEGRIQYGSGNKKKAEELFMGAISLNPNNYLYFQALYQMYNNQGRYADAYLLLSKYFQKYPESPFVLYEMGKYFHSKKDYLTAEIAYTKAIKRNSKFLVAVNGLGELYMEMNRYREAQKQFQKVLRLNKKIAQMNLNKVKQLIASQSKIHVEVSVDLSTQEDQMNSRLSESWVKESPGKENLARSVLSKTDIFESRKGKENSLGTSNRVNNL